jgi:cob(I)alamin adenosyltransferase
VPLYTRTGDRGETSLFDGTRVSKADPRVAAYGDVDEVGAWLGYVRAAGVDPDVDDLLAAIQRDLMAAGARLADPQHRIAPRVAKAQVGTEASARLEAWIDRFDAEVPPLRRFILSGGGLAGAALHLARVVCRRAERQVAALGQDAGHDDVLVYLNRLSDLLFALARAVNHRAGQAEEEW